MSRLFDSLSCKLYQSSVVINPEMRLDLNWFRHLLLDFQGVHLMRQQTTQITLTVDSCLTGAGAVTNSHFYTLTYPPANPREGHAHNTVGDAKRPNSPTTMGPHVDTQKRPHLLRQRGCSPTLQSGRAKHHFLRAAARETWLLAALADIHLTVRHRPGASSSMRATDALSRAHLNQHFLNVVTELEAAGSKRVSVPLHLLADPSTEL